MDCHTAELMVHRYIRHGLTDKELSDFIDHIEHCSSCYEELEMYFIVHEATRQLDDPTEEEDVFDFKGLLKRNIRENKVMLKRKKRASIISSMMVMIAGVAFVGFVAEVLITFF